MAVAHRLIYDGWMLNIIIINFKYIIILVLLILIN